MGSLRAYHRYPANFYEKPPNGYARSNKMKNLVVNIVHYVIMAINSVLVSAYTYCSNMNSHHHKDLSASLGSCVIGTMFDYRRWSVNFAVQEDLRPNLMMLLELATLTNSLVKEMSSRLVRINLECERTVNRENLFQEPRWNMYCNGRKVGYAMRRSWYESKHK